MPASSIASWPRLACTSYDVRRSVQATCSQYNWPSTRNPDSSTCSTSASRNMPFTASVDGSMHLSKCSDPRSRGLSEHGVFSCEECSLPAHMQGWRYPQEEDFGKKCQRWVVTRDSA